MKSIKKLHTRLGTIRNYKLVLGIFLIATFLISPTFAQDLQATSQGSEILRNTQVIIDKIVQFAGRSRIVIAALAGKFMTNDLVYGSWMHLDVYLRKLRNIFKNFANFGLLGILLRNVFQYITKNSGNVQKIVKSVLIGGILIQSSRFIISILLDISTIATAAVGSFPMNFINESALSKSTIQNQMANNMKKFSLKLDKEGQMSMKVNNDNSNTTVEEFIDSIMPKSDIISGPLVYIGATTLNIQGALQSKDYTSPSFQKVVTGSALQVLMILMYCAVLLLLLMVNIIRVGLLRVIIPLSPIIALMMATEQKGLEKINKNLKPSVIIDLIFKPVIFTAVLSFILIFIVSMQNLMGKGSGGNISIQGTTLSTTGSVATMDIQGISTININDTLFQDAGSVGKNIFSNIIIYFATIFLMRFLVKTAIKGGGGTIGDVMDSSTKLVESMARTTPLLSGYSSSAMLEGGNDILKNIGNRAGVNLNFKSGNDYLGKIENRNYQDRFSTKVMGNKQRTNSELSELQTAKNFDMFMNKTQNILNDKSLSYKYNAETFNTRETYFNKALQSKVGLTNEFIKKKNIYFKPGTKDGEEKIENLNKVGFERLHELLGGDDTKVPKDYDAFKEEFYGKDDTIKK